MEGPRGCRQMVRKKERKREREREAREEARPMHTFIPRTLLGFSFQTSEGPTLVCYNTIWVSCCMRCLYISPVRLYVSIDARHFASLLFEDCVRLHRD